MGVTLPDLYASSLGPSHIVCMTLNTIRIHMLHKLKLVVMYMYEGPLEYIQHLYLYGSVIGLYRMSI